MTVNGDIIITSKLLERIDILERENKQLKEQVEEYKQQNANLRADIIIEKNSIPIENIKNKTFYNLYNMPTYEELKKTITELRNNYFNLYYDILCEKVSKLYPYYDIDKIKDYGVYVWNKADNLDDQDNIFDIMSDEIVFYTDDHTIIEEAKPIIKDIQNFIKKYYEKLFVGKESE